MEQKKVTKEKNGNIAMSLSVARVSRLGRVAMKKLVKRVESLLKL